MRKPRSTARCLLLTLAMSMALGSLTTQAHHPVSAKFDTQESVALEGIVTKVDWRNPHAHVFMNVQRDNGEVENWAIELESPSLLSRQGWQKDTVRPGDRLQVKGLLARNGSRQIWSEDLRRSDQPQQALFVLETPAITASRAAVPRWDDGQPALGAISGETDGYWSLPSLSSLMEDGQSISFDRFGLLDNLDDADKVAPFQPWALALYRHRQQRKLQDDPVYLNCKPPGGPRQFQSDLGVQFIEDRASERVFVLMGSGNRNYRLLYLDGRDRVGQVGGDDDNPLYYGRSTGQWQGDTLVVSTTSFNEDFWLSNGGLPHTEHLALEERFTRIDQSTLRYEVTINDPGAYTRPWTASWTLQWMEGEALPVHFCQHNRV